APTDAGTRRFSEGDVVARAELSPHRGEQSVAAVVGAEGLSLNARLVGSDACRYDDEAPVSEESTASVVAVVADPASASARTGGDKPRQHRPHRTRAARRNGAVRCARHRQMER